MRDEKIKLPNIWLPHDITPAVSLMYELGPLEVVISRRTKEFRFYYKYHDLQLIENKPNVKQIETKIWRAERDMDEQHDPYNRYRVTGNNDPGNCSIKLFGRCADRLFVARPKSSIQITSGHSIDVFVTTPVWIEFEEVYSNVVIYALPTWSPRRTWLGPPTGTGPLCYSTLIHARLSYEDIRHFAMRVITHLTIQNDGAQVELDRFVIPTPMLQVYLNERGELWTESVLIRRTSNGAFSKVKIQSEPPEIAGVCRLLSGRREELPDPMSFQSIFHSLFNTETNIQLN